MKMQAKRSPYAHAHSTARHCKIVDIWRDATSMKCFLIHAHAHIHSQQARHQSNTCEGTRNHMARRMKRQFGVSEIDVNCSSCDTCTLKEYIHAYLCPSGCVCARVCLCVCVCVCCWYSNRRNSEKLIARNVSSGVCWIAICITFYPSECSVRVYASAVSSQCVLANCLRMCGFHTQTHTHRRRIVQLYACTMASHRISSALVESHNE